MSIMKTIILLKYQQTYHSRENFKQVFLFSVYPIATERHIVLNPALLSTTFQNVKAPNLSILKGNNLSFTPKWTALKSMLLNISISPHQKLSFRFISIKPINRSFILTVLFSGRQLLCSVNGKDAAGRKKKEQNMTKRKEEMVKA